MSICKIKVAWEIVKSYLYIFPYSFFITKAMYNHCREFKKTSWKKEKEQNRYDEWWKETAISHVWIPL